MTGPAKLLSSGFFRDVDSGRFVTLKTGQEVRVLYYGADQDGFDGEAICAVPFGLNRTRVAINPELLEMV